MRYASLKDHEVLEFFNSSNGGDGILGASPLVSVPVFIMEADRTAELLKRFLAGDPLPSGAGMATAVSDLGNRRCLTPGKPACSANCRPLLEE